jgi:hypothetical protein
MTFFSWPPGLICFSSPCKPKGRRRLRIEPLEPRHVLAAPFAEFIDPDPTIGDGFGTDVEPLKNGNVVITAPFDDAGGKDAGAVYLFRGATGALISTLTGSHDGDVVGLDGVTPLANGNFVVVSEEWNGNKGAVTWGSGVIGVSGVVSAANSLVGSAAGDSVGSGGVTALDNGNYVIASADWSGDSGAATFAKGATGITGPITATNSLIGSHANDSVGLSIKKLGTDNYVVVSPFWSSSTTSEVGAVTFGGDEFGVHGTISAANSLVGSQTEDRVGVGGVVPLQSGSYVVVSPNWDRGTTIDAGAVTWSSGNGGIRGEVALFNSLIGSTGGDRVGSGGATPLVGGNFVVSSPDWTNGAVAGAGAVTFRDETILTSGVVSVTNSLVGGSTGDHVGGVPSGQDINFRAVIPLTDGNYVVDTPQWDSSPTNTDVGAVTFVSGGGGISISGPITTNNSLVGTTSGDLVGFNDVTALTNGNYVVASPFWHNGPIQSAGAVTFGDGTIGVHGAISGANSLVGSTANDLVGSLGIGIDSSTVITPLPNGNYVVNSPNWDNGTVVDAGAVTWGSGISGVHGSVSQGNSLVGSTSGDFIGSNGVVALTNGNYVVGSAVWANGSMSQAGAATWGNGAIGTSGPVTTANSLVGSNASDHVGQFLGPLTNGNYVVASPEWRNVSLFKAGAVTFGNGASGISGSVSPSNSLVGSSDNDFVGNNGNFFRGLPTGALSNGNFVVGSVNYHNGSAIVGAMSFGNGTTGVSGPITTTNSALGNTAASEIDFVADDPAQIVIGAFIDTNRQHTNRVLVASEIDGFAHPWHDASRPLDATNDAHIAPNDALAVINYINAFGPGAVPAGALPGKPFGFIDVDGNDFIAPNDALKIINQINAFGSSEGEGEGASDTAAIDAVLAATSDQDLLAALSLDPFYGTSANSAKARRT